MAIELFWDNDARTVMLCEFERHWTWDEMDATLNKIKQVTDQADREIAAIIDVSQGVSIPGGSIFTPTAYAHARKMLQMGEGGTGPIVVVGASPLIKTIYSTFRSLDQNGLGSVEFAHSVDEARAILAQRHHTYAEVPN